LTYDAFDRMVRHRNGGEDWAYFYTADDERVLARKLGGPKHQRWTVRGLDHQVLGSFLEQETSPGQVTWSEEAYYLRLGSQLVAAITNEGVRHFHLDHLGTPRLVTDSSGTPVAFHTYFPYGGEATTANQTDERLKFTGHERDLLNPAGPGDDLDYMHARHHSPILGRFLGVDPAAAKPLEPSSWNRYSYVSNNPLKYIDPTGMAQVCTGSGDSRACVHVDGNGDRESSDNDLTEEQIQVLAAAYAEFILANDGADLVDKGTTVSGGSEADRSLIRAASQFVGANLENGWQNTEIVLSNLGAGEAGRLDWLRNAEYPAGVYLVLINPGEANHGGNPSSIARTLTHEFLHRAAMSVRGHTSAHRELDDRAKALIRAWGLARMGCPALGGRTWFGFGPQFYSGC
jgi:RHS repeat-associated protein